MPVEKGKTNNPNGRPPGSKSERTKQWEELGESLLTRHSGRANQILETCDDEMFMENYSKLLNYFKPQLARQNIDVTTGGEPIKAPNIIIPGPETQS